MLFFIVTLLTLLLQACGFQLRGAINLSEKIAPVYIEKNQAFDLAREIRALLIGNGIKMVDDAGQSNSQLVLLSESKQQRVLSVDGKGRAKEYLLTYSVNFEIKRTLPADEKVASKRDTVSVSRTLLFDPDTVLAVTNEAEVIYKNMRQDVARLILLKLQSFSMQTAGSEKAADEAADPVNGSAEQKNLPPVEPVGSQTQ
jgi:LPS-assembly lipoprotein